MGKLKTKMKDKIDFWVLNSSKETYLNRPKMPSANNIGVFLATFSSTNFKLLNVSSLHNTNSGQQ